MEPIPFHLHNGQDSPRVNYDDLDNKPVSGRQSASSVLFSGQQNEITNTYIHQFAFSPDWKRLVGLAGSLANQMVVMHNPGGNKAADIYPRLGTQPTVTPGSASGPHMIYYAPADKFVACDNGTNSLYSYDNNDILSGEVLLTVSGTTLANVAGLAADENYIYAFNGTSTVKTFTLSGATLTYVATITLGDSTTKRYLGVDDGYIYTMDIAGTPQKYWIFDKATGATITSWSSSEGGTTTLRGFCTDPDGNLRQLVGTYQQGSATSTTLWRVGTISLI